MQNQPQSKCAKKAIIIGGGIAGPALAVFLHRIGIESEVFEAHEMCSKIGGGLQIAPNGMRVLGQLGVAEKIVNHGGTSTHFNCRNEKGDGLTRIRCGRTDKYEFGSVPMTHLFLHQTVLGAAIEVGVKVHYNKRLTEIDQSAADSVTAVFADGTRVTGDFLVGADGIGSTVRTTLFPSSPTPIFTGFLSVGGFTELTPEQSALAGNPTDFNMTFGRFGQFGITTCERQNAAKRMWWVRLPSLNRLTRSEVMALGTEELRARCLEKYSTWHAPVADVIKGTKEILAVPISYLPPIDTWHKGRVILIGDAAHAMTPNAGQGASVSLEDSLYLAKCLRDNDTLEEAFVAFEVERKPRCDKINAQARRNTENLQEIGPWRQWFRDIFFKYVFYYFGERMMDTSYGYQIDF